MYKKRNGIYYTPPELSSLITNYLKASDPARKFYNVLEPSCGDCRFVKTIKTGLKVDGKIIGIEKDKKVYRKILLDSELVDKKIKIYNRDFLDFAISNRLRFDLILGNPPYVEYKNIGIDVQKKILKNKDHFYRYGNVRNLWQIFFNECLDMLDEKGVMSLILPTEILQVSYASQLRSLVLKKFKYIEIITIGNGVFPELQQRVIVFIGHKEHKLSGVSFKKMLSSNEAPLALSISEDEFVEKEKIEDKWINNRVSELQNSLVKRIIKKYPQRISDFCNSSTGIVTGANEFFLRSKEESKIDTVLKYHRPILQRGEYVDHCLDFQMEDFEYHQEKGGKSYLLSINNNVITNKKIQLQITNAEKIGISKRYKCSQRVPWYNVNGIDVGEGYFFKRIYKYPKLVKNSANVLATDVAYKIKMKSGFKIESLIFSFYNSFTLAQTELAGRIYGGVLELTPSEFKSLNIPYTNITKAQFKKADKVFRDTKDINQLIDYVDGIVFKKNISIKQSDLSKLQKLRRTLVLNRI